MTDSMQEGNTTEFDTIVIGGGMAGVSIAYELATDQSVAVLEMESTLAYHTTGRSAATFLESYGNRVVRMLTSASRDFFTDPLEGFDEHIASAADLLVIADHTKVDTLRDLYLEVGGRSEGIELVDGDTAEKLNPALRAGYTRLGMLDPSALELDVHAIHQGYVRGFRRRGGTIVKSAKIVSGRKEQSAWVLEDASGQKFRATTVVNAAGAWCDEVATTLGAEPVGIQPLRRTAFMVSDSPHRRGGTVPFTLEAAESFYFKPDGAQFLCSPADETYQNPGDARPDELEIARAIENINEATTLGIRSVNSSWAGLRSFTADRSPVAGFDPQMENFFWYVGQGGYGIQMAPAMARMGAALATRKSIPDDLIRAGVSEPMVAPDRESLRIVTPTS